MGQVLPLSSHLERDICHSTAVAGATDVSVQNALSGMYLSYIVSHLHRTWVGKTIRWILARQLLLNI